MLLRTKRLLRLLRKCVQALNIKLKRSILLTVFLCLLTILSLLCCFLNSLTVELQLLLVALVFILTARSFKFIYTFNGIQLKQDGTWCLYEINGGVIKAILLGSTTVFPSLISLTFKTKAGNKNIVILKDSLIEGDNWRRLRFVLKVYSAVLLKVKVTV